MAKKKSSAALSHGETVAGLIFLALYLFVLPLAKSPAFRLAEKLLDLSLSASLENAIYYYLLFAVTIVIFHGYLCRTSRRFLDNLGLACQTVGVGLVALYLSLIHISPRAAGGRRGPDRCLAGGAAGGPDPLRRRPSPGGRAGDGRGQALSLIHI